MIQVETLAPRAPAELELASQREAFHLGGFEARNFQEKFPSGEVRESTLHSHAVEMGQRSAGNEVADDGHVAVAK